MNSSGNAKTGVWVVTVSLVVGGIVAANHWINKETHHLVSSTAPSPLRKAPVSPSPTVPVHHAKSHDRGITRRDKVSLNRNYVESVFFSEGEEIGRQKIINGRVAESIGRIPEGTVRFKDESKGTYGKEHYVNGKKDGPSNTFFSDGRLREEALFRHGRLVWRKRYYAGGGLRMETDYSDARNYGDDPEVGVGKMYYPNGKLKYEWHMTNSDAEGFKKSYSQDGMLRAALYFDQYGQLVRQTP